jgi:hypothetical protein
MEKNPNALKCETMVILSLCTLTIIDYITSFLDIISLLVILSPYQKGKLKKKSSSSSNSNSNSDSTK